MHLVDQGIAFNILPLLGSRLCPICDGDDVFAGAELIK